jgi:hypothetical protein
MDEAIFLILLAEHLAALLATLLVALIAALIDMCLLPLPRRKAPHRRVAISSVWIARPVAGRSDS